MPCSLVDCYQCIDGTCHFRHLLLSWRQTILSHPRRQWSPLVDAVCYSCNTFLTYIYLITLLGLKFWKWLVSQFLTFSVGTEFSCTIMFDLYLCIRFNWSLAISAHAPPHISTRKFLNGMPSHFERIMVNFRHRNFHICKTISCLKIIEPNIQFCILYGDFKVLCTWPIYKHVVLSL